MKATLLLATLLGNIGLVGAAHASLVGHTLIDTEIFGTTTVQVNGPVVVPATFTIRAGPAASIEVSSNTITYNFLEDGVYTTSPFNGSQFTDLTEPFATATIDFTTTVSGVSDADLSISGGDLFVNLAGVRFSIGEQIIIDVATGAIPEPASLALLGIGVLGLGFVHRRGLAIATGAISPGTVHEAAPCHDRQGHR